MPLRNPVRIQPLLLTLALFISALGQGAPQKAPSPAAIFVDSKGVAIAGYDVVSYFAGTKPTKGSSRWKAEFKGAQFHFASAANRDRFLTSPEAFVPQFGGYCAFSMGNGTVRACDPRHFSLKDGKLFLFGGAEARDTWQQDTDSWFAKAIAKWRELVEGA